jgi:hypothetical protein
MGCGLGGFLGVEGLDTRFYGEIRGKNLRERAELEVDPPFARKKRRMGHLYFVGNQDFKNLVWTTRRFI